MRVIHRVGEATSAVLTAAFVAKGLAASLADISPIGPHLAKKPGTAIRRKNSRKRRRRR